jgi:hypothetical protein
VDFTRARKVHGPGIGEGVTPSATTISEPFRVVRPTRIVFLISHSPALGTDQGSEGVLRWRPAGLGFLEPSDQSNHHALNGHIVSIDKNRSHG